jgi:excisionase family DNA binding protein
MLERRLLTVKELAVVMNVKAATIYQWAELRQIPHIKLNGSLRFDLQDIQSWVESCKVSPESRYNPLVQTRSPRKGGV